MAVMGMVSVSEIANSRNKREVIGSKVLDMADKRRGDLCIDLWVVEMWSLQKFFC